MKTFLFGLLILVMGFGMTACSPSENSDFAIVYDLNVTGEGDGQFDVTFPNGDFGMNGKADLYFVFSNDTTKLLMTDGALSIEEIEASNDPQKVAALTNVETWLNENFQATSASGTYDLTIKGYVKETLTGLVIAIDKRITNRK